MVANTRPPLPRRKIAKIDHYRWLRSDGTPNFSDSLHKFDREITYIIKSPGTHITPTTTIMKTIEEMNDYLRTVPVVVSKKLVGVVASMDVVNYLGGGELFNIIEKRHGYDIYSALYRERTESIMETNLVVSHPDDRITDVVSKMLYSKIGFLPVVDRENNLLGILTEHDIVKHLYGLVKTGVKVSEIMSKPVVVIGASKTVREAMVKMVTYGFRRLPITDGDLVIGIVTSMDIVRFFSTHKAFEYASTRDIREIHKVRVEELMRRDIVAVGPDDDVSKVIQEMMDKNVDSAMVVNEEGVLEGIITERDILYVLATR